MTVKQKRRKQKQKRSSAEPVASPEPAFDLSSYGTLGWAMFSAFALWLAFPPVGWWALAWIAPFGWLRLVRMTELPGKRPYFKIAIAAYVHWLLMAHWVALPCAPAAVGLLFLAAYLSIYLVGFIALSRWFVHRLGWSSIVAAPVAWVALEYIRSVFLTGFALCSLSHSQVNFVPVMQISQYTGAYGVSFLVMLVAAACERCLASGPDAKRTWRPLVPVLGVVALAIGFGFGTTRSTPQTNSSVNAARVAIVQGSLDTEFGGEESKQLARKNAFQQYLNMTSEVTHAQKIDLVVWPESMFRYDEFTYDDELADTETSPNDYTYREWARLSSDLRKMEIRDFRTKCLFGMGTDHYRKGGVDRYNTAALYDPLGERIGAYHKMHPVMFGEYIPLGDIFPWIYTSGITPLPSGLLSGDEPKSFEAGGVAFVPNICFENTVPHLIRQQLQDLRSQGERPDVLVTLTNDGWFWGSALLDLHLACGIYRAVENGMPMLIAANTGFSAHIDRHGRVLQKGPRRASRVLVTDVQRTSEPESLPTFYTRYGDVFAFGNLMLAMIGALLGLVVVPRKAIAEATSDSDTPQETQ